VADAGAGVVGPYSVSLSRSHSFRSVWTVCVRCVIQVVTMLAVRVDPLPHCLDVGDAFSYSRAATSGMAKNQGLLNPRGCGPFLSHPLTVLFRVLWAMIFIGGIGRLLSMIMLAWPRRRTSGNRADLIHVGLGQFGGARRVRRQLGPYLPVHVHHVLGACCQRCHRSGSDAPKRAHLEHRVLPEINGVRP
jgi:hypothetical protein